MFSNSWSCAGKVKKKMPTLYKIGWNYNECHDDENIDILKASVYVGSKEELLVCKRGGRRREIKDGNGFIFLIWKWNNKSGKGTDYMGGRWYMKGRKRKDNNNDNKAGVGGRLKK